MKENTLKEAVCSCISTFVSSFNGIPVERFIKYIKSTFLYMNIIQIKANKKLVQMSCAVYIVYTFLLSLHHANFGQIIAKQVLCYQIRENLIHIRTQL